MGSRLDSYYSVSLDHHLYVREYLRIINGPECTALEHLERLRARGLGTKRSLALRVFARGIESL
jgi:hypothetical protein